MATGDPSAAQYIVIHGADVVDITVEGRLLTNLQSKADGKQGGWLNEGNRVLICLGEIVWYNVEAQVK